MEKKTITTSEQPKIWISTHGNLSLKGETETEVSVKASSAEDLNIDQDGDSIRITCQSECRVKVPSQAMVTIEAAHGEATIKALEGELTVEDVHGNLSLRYTGPVHIDQVRGNLSAKHISGDFLIERVDGNANVRDVQGAFQVDRKIHGNLVLDDVAKGSSADVDGNATLRLDPEPGSQYEFHAGGNLICRLPSDASASITVERASNLKVDIGGKHLSERENFPFQATFGDGEADMSFEAGGNLLLTESAPDWEMAGEFDASFESDFAGMAEDLGQQVAQQIETQMEMLGQQLDAQMENLTSTLSGVGLSPEQAARITQRAQEASARAAARAQEKMRQAQEKMQRKLEAAQRRAEQKARMAERFAHKSERRSWGFSWPGTKTEPEGEPVSEEEQMTILNMLQEGKITAEEAEQLLAALEGK